MGQRCTSAQPPPRALNLVSVMQVTEEGGVVDERPTNELIRGQHSRPAARRRVGPTAALRYIYSPARELAIGISGMTKFCKPMVESRRSSISAFSASFLLSTGSKPARVSVR